MPNTYETWRETKRLLEDESVTDEQDAYYQAVLDSLQPEALHAYLTEFVASNFNYTDEVADIEAGDIPKFLAGLDELRAPNLGTAKQLFFNPAIGQVSRLREMNWTGDNTYGEALDDVIQVLLAVWEGKPFPKLERFRCPSLYDEGDLRIRCVEHLPHSEVHWGRLPSGDRRTWTDEQAVNPPKNYDDPIKPTDAHLDKLAAEVFGDEKPGIRCLSLFEGHRCRYVVNHPGTQHRDGDVLWDTEQQTAGNPDPINRPLNTPPRCTATYKGERCTRAEHSQFVGHKTESGVAW